MEKKILLGLDIGTNSVGWCVTDENYQIIKKQGKSLWGVRMFDEASDASERRSYRTNRRRLHRRNERLSLLRDIFNEPMSQIDSSFFYRLDNAMIHNDDKTEPFKYTLFNDLNFNDSDYYKKYPTIYHLRHHLINSNEKEDLRLIYLAFHHMIKYRGHFLNEGEEFKGINENDLENDFILLNEKINELDFEDFSVDILHFNNNSLDTLMDVFKNIRGKMALKEEFNSILNPNKNDFLKKIIIPLILGFEASISDIRILNKEELEKTEIKKICAKDEKYDDNIEELKTLFDSYSQIFDLFVICKKIYQFFLLSKLLGKNKYISDAMIEQFNKHKNELKKLKMYIKEYLPNEYGRLFRKPKEKEINYSAYIGSYISNNEQLRFNHGSKIEFYKLVKQILGLDNIKKTEDINDEYLKEVYLEIENDSYLSFINSTSNGVFPYQLNLLEMEIILEKQSKFYPFLNEFDSEGYITKNKIKSLLTFKIPYYVGPLAKPSSNNHSWIVRKEEGKITPWNFDAKVDKDASAKQFIERMLTKCTYLHNCYCLPANSIVFSYYNVLSFLNKIHINGELIDYETKIDLIKTLFLEKRKVSNKDINDYFYLKDKNIIISNSKGNSLETIKCNMASYVDFVRIFGKEYVENNIDLIEKIIRDIVIFEDKKILEKRLFNEYHLDSEKIKQIKGLNYKNYGRLSNELLTKIISYDENGEVNGSILSIMQKSNQNLMEVIYDERYNFSELISDYNKKNEINLSPEEYIENLYVSPGMKRPLIQAYKIIVEIEKIIGKPIDEFYVECTRSNEQKKERTKSRYERLKEMYQKAEDFLKDDITYKKLHKELINIKDTNCFQSDKYYLYFTQMGKCMYTGEPIALEDLFDTSKYDIDHIIPQAMIKDDSINNRVLVKSEANRAKKDQYPIPQSILWKGDYHKAYAFYSMLRKSKLITEEKYNRLVKRELTEAELSSFVNRQLVYTNQAVKGLVEVLKQYRFNDDYMPKIVYSKSENVSSFRKLFDLPKSRTANNFHHAHDAYLNIVVGRIIDLYFNPYRQNHITLKRMHADGLTTNQSNIFKKDVVVQKSGYVLWDKERIIKLVNHYFYETFDVLTTTRVFVGTKIFHKITIYSANGGANIPIKTSQPLCQVNKYGGLSSYVFGFYSLIKVKDSYILEAIPAMFKNNVSTYLDTLYSDYEVEIEELKTNTVFLSEHKKYCITGKTGNQYLLMNLYERFFNKSQISLIRLIDKAIEKMTKLKKLSYLENDDEIRNLGFIYENDKLIISPARNENVRELSITNKQLIDFYNDFITMLKKRVYAYGASSNIANFLENAYEKFLNINILGKITIISNLLVFLKCNQRSTIDLSLLGGSKNMGTLLISKKLKDCKIIAESITGFYTKVLKEIK